jgi:hypothetical protein
MWADLEKGRRDGQANATTSLTALKEELGLNISSALQARLGERYDRMLDSSVNNGYQEIADLENNIATAAFSKKLGLVYDDPRRPSIEKLGHLVREHGDLLNWGPIGIEERMQHIDRKLTQYAQGTGVEVTSL